MKISDSKYKANTKWNKENYKRFTVDMPIKDYEVFDQYCKDRNLSKAGFIKEAIKEKMKRENDKD